MKRSRWAVLVLAVLLVSLSVAALLPGTAGAAAGRTAVRAGAMVNDLYDVASSGWSGAVAVGAGGTVIRTTDGGTTWEWPSPDAPIDFRNSFWDVGFDTASGKGWVVGDRGAILATTDDGATWNGNVSGGTWQLRDLCVVSGTTAYAVGGNLVKDPDFDQGVLLCTTDGGVSWNIVPVGDPAFTDPSLDAIQYGAVSVVGNRIWVLGWHYGTRYFIESANGGVSWLGMVDSEQMTDVVQVAPGDGHGYGISGAEILATPNSWVSAGGTNVLQSLNDIDMVSAAIGWVVGNAGEIDHTDNAGGTWGIQAAGTTVRDLNGVDAIPGGAWAVGDYGTILYTTDGGTTWTPLSGPQDTTRPACYATRKAACYRNKYVSLKYRVNDKQSAVVKVRIKIKKLNGHTVKTLGWAQRSTNIALSWRFKCRLAKGKYKYWVYATDLCGNTQSRIGKNYLTGT